MLVTIGRESTIRCQDPFCHTRTGGMRDLYLACAFDALIHDHNRNSQNGANKAGVTIILTPNKNVDYNANSG